MEQGDTADLDEADAWYTRALKLNPNSHQLVYRRAMLRLDRMRLEGHTDWEPVLDEIERAVSLFPTNSHIRLLYAMRLDEAGRSDEAREQFTAAARYDDEAFSDALQIVKQSYNDPSEIKVFEERLARLHELYGTAPDATTDDETADDDAADEPGDD
jgi:tetratricopeptide (TPR) repeat protein